MSAVSHVKQKITQRSSLVACYIIFYLGEYNYAVYIRFLDHLELYTWA